MTISQRDVDAVRRLLLGWDGRHLTGYEAVTKMVQLLDALQDYGKEILDLADEALEARKQSPEVEGTP